MDLSAITAIVQALVQGSVEATNTQVKNIKDEVDRLRDKVDELTRRADIAEGADLKDKLDKLLNDVHDLAISDTRQTEQLITIFKKLGMNDQAKQAQTTLKLHVEGNAQINQGDNQGTKQSNSG